MDFNSITRYLNTDVQTEPLTPKEELDLIRKSHSGNTKARHRLIESNMRFVVKMAMNFRNQGLSLADLIQEGILGLIEALDKFDETKECRLITYASWWIRLYIQRSLEQKSRQINLPINKMDILRKVRAFEKSFESSHGRKPLADEIADELNIDKKKIEELEDVAPSFHNLHTYDESHPGMERVLIDERNSDPREDIWSEEADHRLNAAMDVLNNREREVLFHRYNLKYKTGKTAQSSKSRAQNGAQRGRGSPN